MGRPGADRLVRRGDARLPRAHVPAPGADCMQNHTNHAARPSRHQPQHHASPGRRAHRRRRSEQLRQTHGCVDWCHPHPSSPRCSGSGAMRAWRGGARTARWWQARRTPTHTPQMYKAEIVKMLSKGDCVVRFHDYGTTHPTSTPHSLPQATRRRPAWRSCSPSHPNPLPQHTPSRMSTTSSWRTCRRTSRPPATGMAIAQHWRV